MSPFGDTAFKTRIEGITGKKRQNIGLICESGMRAIVVYYGLETRDSSYRFGGPRSALLERVSGTIKIVVHTRHGRHRCNGLTGDPDDQS